MIYFWMKGSFILPRNLAQVQNGRTVRSERTDFRECGQKLAPTDIIRNFAVFIMIRMTYLAAWIPVVILLIVIPSQAQLGTECSATRLCMSDQTCFYGYCKCNAGFVKNIRQCFPVRGYGQMCFVHTQCTDLRMICAKINATDIMKKCTCDSFHEWDENSQSCTQTMNLTEMMETMTEKYDNSGRIFKEAQTVFLGALIAGLIVIVIGIASVIGCLIYGCSICRRNEYTIHQPEKFVKIDPGKQGPKSKVDVPLV